MDDEEEEARRVLEAVMAVVPQDEREDAGEGNAIVEGLEDGGVNNEDLERQRAEREEARVRRFEEEFDAAVAAHERVLRRRMRPPRELRGDGEEEAEDDVRRRMNAPVEGGNANPAEDAMPPLELVLNDILNDDGVIRIGGGLRPPFPRRLLVVEEHEVHAMDAQSLEQEAQQRIDDYDRRARELRRKLEDQRRAAREREEARAQRDGEGADDAVADEQPREAGQPDPVADPVPEPGADANAPPPDAAAAPVPDPDAAAAPAPDPEADPAPAADPDAAAADAARPPARIRIFVAGGERPRRIIRHLLVAPPVEEHDEGDDEAGSEATVELEDMEEEDEEDGHELIDDPLSSDEDGESEGNNDDETSEIRAVRDNVEEEGSEAHRDARAQILLDLMAQGDDEDEEEDDEWSDDDFSDESGGELDELFFNGFRGIHEGRRKLKVTEAMIADANAQRTTDAEMSDSSPNRYTRVCSICMVNPSQRVGYTKCGHIICYPCAIDVARRKESNGTCPCCRSATGFVKLHEEVEQPKDAEGSSGDNQERNSIV